MLRENNPKKNSMISFNEKWYKQVSEFIKNADVISCDVFDTLIHRKIRKPTDLFHVVSERILHEGTFPDEAQTVLSFPTLRVYAEQHARHQTFDLHEHHEVSIDYIYEVFQELSGCSPELSNHLREKEIHTEVEFTYANPIMLRVVKERLAAGKKVILCSDMYSSSEEILDRVEKAGYPKGIDIIVSCENACSKHDGKLFTTLKSKFSPYSRIVHIGDNLHADVKMARKNDIDSLHFDYKEEIDKQFLSHISQTDESLPNCLAHGFARFLLISNPEKANDIWYQSGVAVFGPLFLGYFLWLIDHLKKEKFSKILFLARDGYFFHRAFAKWHDKLDIHVPYEYIYASRGTLLYPSLTDMNWDRLWFQFGGRQRKSVKNICKKLEIPSSVYLEKAIESDIHNIEEEMECSDPRFHKFFVLLGMDILKHSREKRDILRKYLTQHISQNDHIALCDIGWAGNMQGGISRVWRSYGWNVSISGFYFGTFPWSHMNLSIHDKFYGYLVNGSSVQDLNDVLFNGGVELLEFATMAPHGTTLGYKDEGDKVVPVLEQNDNDKRMQALSAAIQNGAWDFMNEIMGVLMTMDEKLFLNRSWSNTFIHFVTNPTPYEARNIGVVTHSDAPGSTDNRSYLVSTPRSKKAKDVDDAEKHSFWKFAFRTLYRP